ncbi:ly-6/neurotoxin-like protein 1 [Sorex fumeus]|uniref:ly-6/neurotoxin-like protein 1 n=1 Tax=Sorex fumeus TaxID=62283 RepID=UPI0024ACFBE8|nr:ly-6/neurotoxin-like protein 1 [Sorex fumeus]
MGKMKTVALLLLLAFQCLDGVWALKCHTCLPDAETCAGPVQCSPEHKACLHETVTITEKQTMINHTKVIKTCVKSCLSPGNYKSEEEKILDILEFSVDLNCCTTDLCNAAPSQGLGVATIGMILLAPLLATFLWDFPDC